MSTSLLAAAGSVAAAPAVDDFFKPDAYADVRLSPSGKRLAATIPASTGRRSLVVVDIADPSKSKVVAAYSNADVRGAQWVNDERLVFRIFDQKETRGNQRDGSGLFAVDADGKEAPRMLISPVWMGGTTGTNIASRTLQPDHVLHQTLRDGSDDVLIDKFIWTNFGDVSQINLSRLNTRTGELRSLSAGAPEHVRRWTADRRGQPRLVVTEFDGKQALYWKVAGDEGKWVKVRESTLPDGVPDPIYVESDRRVYAKTRVAPDTDVTSLAVMSLTPGAENPKAEPLLTVPGFDFRGGVVINRSGAVLGVHYTTEAPGTHWFDAAMKKVQDQVDALLPASNNLLDCGDCENVDNVLVTSTSDRLPPVYRIFRMSKGAIEPLLAARPWIKPQEMAGMDMVRVPARDGLSIPVYVTRPNGQKGPAPMVVLVHGGPFLRGVEWEWRDEAQFLASRGYVVIEPEFRGSMGYGYKHYRAGWKQWGLAMQDDIADAALWAVKQGYADRQRICIAGASYGGYATLMGLIRNPELYRCGVEWAGVTDLDLMYTINWSDFEEQYKQFGMPVLVGDREKDRAQLDATSPIKLAAKITQPLFMAHGSVDRRVPIDHFTQMRDAVRKTNEKVEWKVYADEGHGWTLPANDIDFWTRVEQFLDKNLKNAAAP
ncbi:MAG TPA: prolyl oligopeptidase family serine peptidase [Burkholderiaceae bacterium]